MRREYVGGAQSARLTTLLGGTTGDLTIYCNDLSNWPTGVSGRPFYVVVDRGLVSEEKILCSLRNNNTLTVYNDGITTGRGADDTSITSHSINSVIEHVFTATDADEANAATSLLQSGSDGDILVSDNTQPTGAKWENIQGTLSIINPFLLMGA